MRHEDTELRRDSKYWPCNIRDGNHEKRDKEPLLGVSNFLSPSIWFHFISSGQHHTMKLVIFTSEIKNIHHQLSRLYIHVCIHAEMLSREISSFHSVHYICSLIDIFMWMLSIISILLLMSNQDFFFAENWFLIIWVIFRNDTRNFVPSNYFFKLDFFLLFSSPILNVLSANLSRERTLSCVSFTVFF